MKKMDVAFLISSDMALFEVLKDKITAVFNLQIQCLKEEDLRQELQSVDPLVFFWDARNYSEERSNFINWLRMHYPGYPLIALLDTENPSNRLELYKLGINLIINVSSDTFEDNLSLIIGAIIADERFGSHSPYKQQSILTFKF